MGTPDSAPRETVAEGTARKKDASPATVKGLTRAALDLPPAQESDAETAAPAKAKEGRPGAATAAIVLMVATGTIGLVLGIFWIGWGRNALGGLLFAVLGGAYLYGGRGTSSGGRRACREAPPGS